MTAKLVFKKHVQNHVAFSTGEATFIDGEVKSGNFNTITDPMNLSLFSHGELRIKVENMVSFPILDIWFGTVDHKTGEFHAAFRLGEVSKNGLYRMKVTDLTSRMAINAYLSNNKLKEETDGSFKVTITGEFKR